MKVVQYFLIAALIIPTTVISMHSTYSTINKLVRKQEEKEQDDSSERSKLLQEEKSKQMLAEKQTSQPQLSTSKTEPQLTIPRWMAPLGPQIRGICRKAKEDTTSANKTDVENCVALEDMLQSMAILNLSYKGNVDPRGYCHYENYTNKLSNVAFNLIKDRELDKATQEDEIQYVKQL